jgi:uncharacterized membrane protein YoaK (UPF0700 family)
MTGAVLAAATSRQAGPLGLLVIALLAIAVFFLGRSMAKHLRRVPPSFDPPTGPAGPAGEQPPDEPPA